MAFLIAIKARDLTDVMFFPWVFFRGVDGVVANGRGFFWFLSFLKFLLFVFFVFLSLLQRLRRVSPRWNKGLLFGRLYLLGPRLLRARLLYNCPLGLHLWGNAIGRAVTLETTDIRVLDHGARSYARFGLCVDYSLHHLFKIHGFPVLLLHLDLNRKLETFSEVANHG